MDFMQNTCKGQYALIFPAEEGVDKTRDISDIAEAFGGGASTELSHLQAHLYPQYICWIKATSS